MRCCPQHGLVSAINGRSSGHLGKHGSALPGRTFTPSSVTLAFQGRGGLTQASANAAGIVAQLVRAKRGRAHWCNTNSAKRGTALSCNTTLPKRGNACMCNTNCDISGRPDAIGRDAHFSVASGGGGGKRTGFPMGGHGRHWCVDTRQRHADNDYDRSLARRALPAGRDDGLRTERIRARWTHRHLQG